MLSQEARLADNSTFVPSPRSYQVVESMRQGRSPQWAADDAIARIRNKYPDFVGALFAVNKYGEHAGASANWVFTYSVRTAEVDRIQYFVVADPPESAHAL